MHNRLNSSRIQKKISDVKENLQVLKEYACKEESAFLSNAESIRAARYSFIVMIEASTNIANHLCTRLLNLPPGSYAESFVLLGNNKIIPSVLSIRLGKMASFRNLLVHGYGKVDDRKMLEIMKNDLEDVEEMLQEFHRLLLENKEVDNDNAR